MPKDSVRIAWGLRLAFLGAGLVLIARCNAKDDNTDHADADEVSDAAVVDVEDDRPDADVAANFDADVSLDAGDGVCVVSPTSVQIGFLNTPTQPDDIGSGLLTCSNNTYDFTFSVSQTVLVAAAQHHALSPPLTKFGFLSDCTSNPSILTSATTESVAAAVLEAGTYGFLYCDDPNRPNLFYVAMSVESVPPTATDTSCSSPQALPYSEPRVLDGLSRVYSFTIQQPNVYWKLYVDTPDTAGNQLSVSIRTACATSATEVAAAAPYLWANGTLGYALGVLTVGTYYAIVTNIGYGNRFGLSVSQ